MASAENTTSVSRLIRHIKLRNGARRIRTNGMPQTSSMSCAVECTS